MMQCNSAVTDPGYLINPFGRVRHAPFTHDQKIINKLGREFQNQNIQSTVQDTVALAYWLMVNYRKQHKLNFKVVNQIHDALLLLVPKNEIEQVYEMIPVTAGNITIPIIGNPLKLGVEIDTMSRWGEKIKDD